MSHESFEALLARHGNDHDKVARHLFDEGERLRQKTTELAAQVPGEGGVVLTKAQAKAYEEYQKLGPPDEIQARIEAGRSASVELKSIEATEGLKAIAMTAGYSPDAFAKLAKNEGLTPDHFETRTVKGDDGREHATVFVKGEGGMATPLPALVARTWPEFAVVLKPDARKASPGTPGDSARRVPVVEVAKDGEGGTPDLKDQIRASSMYAEL